jgi:hypothetical protein
MALQFHHTLERLEIWSAAADGFSFVISHETRSGTGFHGRPGFMATWRPLYKNNFAIRIAGTPFETFADAEEALQRHAKTSNGNERTRGRRGVSRASMLSAGSDPKVFAAGWVDLLALCPPTQGRTATADQGPRTVDSYQSINLGRPLAPQAGPRFRNLFVL